MKSTALTKLRQVLVPYGLLLIVGATLPYWRNAFAPRVAGLVALSLCVVGALLAWRFHTPRLLLKLLLLPVIGTAFLVYPKVAAAHPSAIANLITLVSLLFPLNILVLLFVDEVSFDFEAFGWWAGLIVAEAVIAVGVSRLDDPTLMTWAWRPIVRSLSIPLSLSQNAVALFGVVGLILLLKLLVWRTPTDKGLFWSYCTCFLAFNMTDARLTAVYLGMAAFMANVAVVETAYQVAYHDELTGLPARRAFNRATRNPGQSYSIAIVDIDHFKRFNDTFGHEVGDHVLRKVASQLAEVTGGGQAFRYGGEEFAVLFRDLPAHDAFPHAEALRLKIEQTPFVVRGPDRSNRQRKERRRWPFRRSSKSQTTSLTVSIGLAEPSAGAPTPEQVVKAADSALYQVKESGRNGVQLYDSRYQSLVSRRR